MQTKVESWVRSEREEGRQRTLRKAAKEVHEVFANLTLVLIVLHVAAAAFASFVHRENLVRAMVSGYKRHEPDPKGDNASLFGAPSAVNGDAVDPGSGWETSGCQRCG